MTVLKLAPTTVNQETVDMLEKCLEDAKSGYLQQFVLTGDTSEHSVYVASNYANGLYLLGHLHHQQFVVSDIMRDGGEE